MLLILLILFWGILYFKSPYLFLGISSIFYFIGYVDEYLNILVAFPLLPFYINKEIQNGRTEHNHTLALEFKRWLFIVILSYLGLLTDAISWAFSLYAYISLLCIIVQIVWADENLRIKMKYRAYIGGFFYIIMVNWSRPFEMLIALGIHVVNFLVDFRIPDFKW
jgi:hypothetical protein